MTRTHPSLVLLPCAVLGGIAPALRGGAMAMLLACASGPQPTTPAPQPEQRAPLRSLDEPEAIALIERLLREAKLRPVAGWQVALPERAAFEVDLRLGDTGFGIEWVSAQDRTRYGELLPAPGPGGQLRLLNGAEDARPKPLILVLDHESYRFASRDRSHTAQLHAASPDGDDVRDLEQRLRRDLMDFLEYARSQYRL
jgi:hypothetical protein